MMQQRTVWIKRFYIFLGIWTTIAVLAGAYFIGVSAVPVTLLGAAILAAGFKITELLVAVLTGVRKANGTAVALLFMLKISWWGALFFLSKVLNSTHLYPLALGFGAFLAALISSILYSVGMPKISAPNE